MTTIATIGKYEVRVFREEKFFSEYHIYEEADDETITEGSVKWDGCSNWDMKPDGVVLHFCGIDDIKHYHEALIVCYQHAKKRLDPSGDWE